MEANGNTLRGVSKLMFENDSSVNFHIGAEDAVSTRCGIMKVVEIYKERFLLCHSVINGKLISRFPVTLCNSYNKNMS